jgi:MoxR-like ATPase
VKLQRLIAAAAALDGRAAPGPADLWPIIYAVPTAEGQAQARDALRDLLAASANTALGAAAAEASLSGPARAQRLIDAGRALLADPGSDGWRLRLESVAREIDAGFAAAARPPALSEIRTEIVAALAGSR